jgi:hypothetical protein
MIWNLKIVALTATSILLVGSVVYAYNSGRQSGMQEVQILWDSEKLALTQAQAEEVMKARQTEQALRALVDQQKQEHRREVNRIVSRYNADLDSLRNRPEARAGATGVPTGADSGTGCTGLGLSKPDSEFLVWLGGEAARAQAALNACQAAYDQVRDAVNAKQNP